MSDDVQVQEMTLRDYSNVVWRRKWLVLIPTLLTALVAGALTLAQTPMYRSSAEVLVRLPANASSLGSTGLVLSPRLIENELKSASGSELTAEVEAIIGTEPTLSVTGSEGSDVFEFTATSSDAEVAALAANTYARQYIERQRRTLLDEYSLRIDVLEAQLDAIDSGDADPARRAEYQRELENLAVSTELARQSGAILINAAVPATSPYEPDLARTVMLAAVVGLLLGLGAAFLVDHLDTSIRSEDDLVVASGVPNLAVIPRAVEWEPGHSHVISLEDSGSPVVEAYRNLRTAVRFLSLDRDLDRVQITSPAPGDGKTTTASNLATVAARAGQRVLLIDCDLRRPQVHRYFDLPNDAGFTSVLLQDKTLKQVSQRVDGEPNLLVVTSGPLPPDPSELLAGERTLAVLDSIGDNVDLVIIDSPPVLAVSDPMVLASIVDGVIVVVSAESTDARMVSRAMSRLHQVDAPVLGTVLNRFDDAHSNRYAYGYDSEMAPADDCPTPATDGARG